MAKGANKLSWSQKPVMGETYRINECCCCLGSLKYGTVLIGVIYTILSLLLVSISFSYIPSMEEADPQVSHGQYGYELGIYGIHSLVTLVKLISILWLIFNLTLLYGALQEKADFLVPWIAWHLVLFFIQVIIAAWVGDIIVRYLWAHAVELGLLIVTVVISECVMVYFLIVVNSFHQKLKERAHDYGRLHSTTTI